MKANGASLTATVRRPSPMPKSRKKKKPPKRVLALPDLEQAKCAVLNTLTSKSGQRTYDHAITEFVEWYCSEPRVGGEFLKLGRFRAVFVGSDFFRYKNMNEID
jgi:hypothetical protein